MKFKELPLKGAFIIEPEPIEDNRGSFARIFCKKEFKAAGNPKEIVQINHSVTRKKGSIRGMHFQMPPKQEIKIIKCIKGSVFDVIVDIRKKSPTFLRWHGVVLSAKNKKMIYIPKGFAHGFQALENDCEMIYFHTEYFNKIKDSGLRFNDSIVGIKWPIKPTIISKKDRNYNNLSKSFRGI